MRAAGFGIDVIATGYTIGPNPWAFMYRSGNEVAIGVTDPLKIEAGAASGPRIPLCQSRRAQSAR
jgi:hypothetical protein